MLNPEQSFEAFMRKSDASTRSEIDRLRAEKKLEIAGLGEKPDLLIAGSWPSSTIGAQRFRCQDCQIFVALGPNSGQPMHAAYPDVPVVCFDCSVKRMDEDAKP